MIYFIRPINRDFVSAHSEEFCNKILTFVKLVNEAGSSLFELTETVESEVFQAIKTGDAEKLRLYAIRFSNILGLSANDIFGKTEITGSVEYNPTGAKMRYLDRFLKERKGITLARAIAVSDEKMKRLLRADKKPSRGLIRRIADYFLLPPTALTDSTPLPPYEELMIDEELLKIQKNDIDDKVVFFRNRHFIRKNYRVLGHGKRVKLVLSLIATLIPLLAYTGYCAGLVTKERSETLDKYRKGSDETEIYDTYSPTQVSYHDKLATTSKENDSNAFYCDVKVGSRLYLISNISYSTNSYITRMELYFKFDKDEFARMFKHYAEAVLDNLILDAYEKANPDELKPSDVSISAWLSAHEPFVDGWVKEHAREYYPGETPSNVLTDKQTMFDIGNGGFVADSYGTVKDLEEKEYIDENGQIRIMCYQKVKFEAKFEKAFDSHRYPLDSIQLKMYIQPTMDASYMRYLPDRDSNSYGETISGYSSFFKLTNGYRLIKEQDDIKNFTQKINYYQDVNNDPATADTFPHTYKTQLEIIVRANRQGISLFLQAFVNLFSVIIWIVIAFYNQSYNGEDSIGMLGTGLFGAISSVLVGISMVSDAGLFSLITMINIFTLGVIMIMTYQSIAARRAVVKQNKSQIAYNGVRLRITFFMLVITTVMMFVGLPMIAYLFGL